ncbi:la-related protein 6-like [Gigantopelta aegis]|uniref:la-related protein 6-like n=1 Tax=Gigantopelta aegis TaxID=1735272 RepID=UPI001B88D78E|nr:la-related protein 6-like [Gigantopelta aegis]
MSENTADVLVGKSDDAASIDDKSYDHAGSPTDSETTTLKLPLLRVEQLKDENDTNSNFSYTSEDDCGSHASEDGDHTPENADGDFEPPDDELRDKIIKQVEFYFSDANLLKDAFLLKHVRRNKLGYVSLKLITSFKKLKSMTKDYRVVAYSLRQSECLRVNEEGTKVCRKDPLPEFDETTPSRTVVAVNLPTENPTMETVAEIFSKCGDIALIRIIRPGKSLPPDVKKHSTRHPEIGNTVCAVVEFEKYEYAKAACDMTSNEDWRNGLRVMALATPKKKEKKTMSNDKKDDVSPDDEEKAEKKKRKRGGRKKKSRVDELVGDSSCCSSSGSETEPIVIMSRLNPKAKEFDPNRLSPTPSPRSSPRTTPKTSPRTQRRNKGAHGKSPLAELSPGDLKPSPRSSPEISRKHLDSSGPDSTPSSPWVQRRLKAAQEMKEKSPNQSPCMGRRNVVGTPKMLDMEGVLRLPRGPDGSEGFYSGLGRGKPRSNTVC